MNNKQQKIPFQATVTRNEVTKGIATFIPEILEESTLALEETFRPPSGSGNPFRPCLTLTFLESFSPPEYVSLPVFHAMTNMIGRISNRAVMGIELCRNEHFVHAVVSFAETLTIYSQLLNWTPDVPGLRSCVRLRILTIWSFIV